MSVCMKLTLSHLTQLCHESIKSLHAFFGNFPWGTHSGKALPLAEEGKGRGVALKQFCLS